MALETSTLNAITEEWYKPNEVHDLVYKDSALLWKMMGWENVKNPNDIMAASGDIVEAKGGTKLRVLLEYAKPNGGVYGAGVTMGTTKSNTANRAHFDWSAYYSYDLVDVNDQIANGGPDWTSPQAIVNLVKMKLNGIAKRIRDDLGTDIFKNATGTALSNLTLVGLGDLFGVTWSTGVAKANTVTYGDIAESEFTALGITDPNPWAPNLISTSEQISFKALQGMTAVCGPGARNKPNLYVTTQALYDSYERQLATLERTTFEQKMADAGFDNIKHKAGFVVVDEKMTAGRCAAINTDHYKIKTHPMFNFTKPVWRETARTAPDNLMADIRWVGAMVATCRTSHCLHVALTA